MKKNNSSIFVLFMLSLALVSCQSIPETVYPSNSPSVYSTASSISPFLVATLNNSNWSVSNPTAYYNSSDSTVTLSGSNSNGSLSVVFNMKQSDKSVVSGQAVVGGTTYSYVGGDLKINSSVNQASVAVSGTFDLTFGSFVITSGTSISTSVAYFNSGSFLVKPN